VKNFQITVSGMDYKFKTCKSFALLIKALTVYALTGTYLLFYHVLREHSTLLLRSDPVLF